ncbi:T9SS type A sorting domain-containing protein [Hymenobacter terrenus]|uniref:T9SS type A sorting domain-containing protein n=1 Tax=Hymenobacter terrenus TaxID=1629124 RepID=UPI00061A0088|nr:T9SS type A sorting domain-containing protein [Hymenobacter terrenus]
MKTIFRSLLAVAAGISLLAIAPAQAQTVPNASLDNWAVRNGNETPVNWLVTNDVLPFLLPFPIPGLNVNNVTKSTAVSNGSFAAQLQTTNVNTVAGTFAVPAVLVLGTRINPNSDPASDDNIPGGLPFTSRPTQFQFDYQLTGPNALADDATVSVQLTRTVNGNVTVIAEIEETLQPSATYTTLSLPLQYNSADQPDTVRIGFISGNIETATAGTTLLVDNISFTGTVTATRNAALAAAISVSPNPSPDGRYVLNTTQTGLLASPLTVLDATGRVVRREAAPGGAVLATRALDLSDLPVGLYTLQLFTNQGFVTRKLTR